MILETSSHDSNIKDPSLKHLLHIQKNGSEFMQDEYLLDNHKAGLWWVYMDTENSCTRNLTNLFYSGKQVDAILQCKNFSISEEFGNQSNDSRHYRLIHLLFVDVPRVNQPEFKYAWKDFLRREEKSNDSDHQATPDQCEELKNTSDPKTGPENSSFVTQLWCAIEICAKLANTVSLVYTLWKFYIGITAQLQRQNDISHQNRNIKNYFVMYQ
ncbi:Hypothetical predicted protein [Cloeon dipterum]|uniref:Uncharacterized protein n=1 Tax=Cloeon dipterum TaxID=197152 RepID=A0A8S1DU39_9INSE|nr:Hypothetical predicted protein [Cloeon dipterum]